MKCTKRILAAVAAGFLASTAMAASVYTQNFDSVQNGTKATDINEYWSSGDQDESVVTNVMNGVALAEGNLLQINTEGDTLTNELAQAMTISSAADIYMDAMVQFVPSDEITTPAADETTKVALYAYLPDSDAVPNHPNPTLVVYHSYQDAEQNYHRVSTDTGFVVDTGVLQRVVVTLKKFEGSYLDSDPAYAFQVTVGGTVVTSTLAYAATDLEGDYFDALDGETCGEWFLTANVHEGSSGQKTMLSSLALSGTGYLDDLEFGTVDAVPVTYTITASVTGGTIATNGAAAAAGAYALATGATVVFTADQGSTLSSVTIDGDPVDGIDTSATSYTYTVADDDATIAVVFAAPAAPTVITVAQTVGAHGGSISNGNFQAVAGVATPITITADQGYVVAQIITNGAPVANALGETSVTFDVVFSDAEGADNSIVATFAPENAWYLEPFIRNRFNSGVTLENTQATAIDEAADMIAFGTAPGASTGGILQYTLSNVTNEFGKVTPYDYVSNTSNLHNGEYWGRSFAAVPPFEAIISCNQINAGVVVVSPYDGPWNGEGDVSYTVSMDMGESGLAAPKLYPITVNKAGTFLYGTDAADGNKIYKFAIVADTQDATKIGSLQYVASWNFKSEGGGDLKGIGVGTFNGNDVVYMAKNASRGLWILDVATGTLTKTAATIAGEVYQIFPTGIADGMPRLVVAGGDTMYVFSLAADGTLLTPTPVYSVATSTFSLRSGSSLRYGVIAVDDESKVLIGNYGAGAKIEVIVVEKKPANLIVRGTFDQGVTADDRSVAFGAAASETFTAPAGETLISVTVNGVAQQIAEGATSFTYEAAELTQYVYIDMQSVEPQYTATYTGSENVIVTNTYDGSSYEWGEGEAVVPTQIACLSGTVLSFYPTEGNVITNVTIGGVEQTGFDPACYSITVISDTNLVVLAGVQAPTTYAVSWTVDKVVVSNTTDSAAIVEAAAGNFEVGAKLTFYPTEGTITNLVVNGAPVADPVSPYEYTVLAQADQTIEAKAGAAPAAENYAAGDTVGAETLNADMAAWLNEKKGAATKAAFEATLDEDDLTLADEYLLNTDPTVETTVDFAISAIAVGTGANLSVTLTRTENSTALATAINGQIVIESCDTPNGTFSGSTAVADGAATVAIGSGDTKKFYRAKVIAK